MDGDCSCPMALNCKHVAATLLDALSETSLRSCLLCHLHTQPSLPLRKRRRPRQSWVSKSIPGSTMSAARRGAANGAADESQRLLYCLGPSDDAMPCLAVSLRSGSPCARVVTYADNYSSPSPYEFKPERAPKYYLRCRCRHHDCCDTRLASGGYFDQGPHTEEVLRRIVATGRAFLARPQADRR